MTTDNNLFWIGWLGIIFGYRYFIFFLSLQVYGLYSSVPLSYRFPILFLPVRFVCFAHTDFNFGCDLMSVNANKLWLFFSSFPFHVVVLLFIPLYSCHINKKHTRFSSRTSQLKVVSNTPSFFCRAFFSLTNTKNRHLIVKSNVNEQKC